MYTIPIPINAGSGYGHSFTLLGALQNPKYLTIQLIPKFSLTISNTEPRLRNTREVEEIEPFNRFSFDKNITHFPTSSLNATYPSCMLSTFRMQQTSSRQNYARTSLESTT